MRTRARFPQPATTLSNTRDIVPSIPDSALKISISNRNFQQLEICVSHRKQSPGPKSNRNFRSTNSPTQNALGRHSCLRNAAHTSPIYAPTHSLSDCGSEATALPLTAKPPSSSLVHLDSSITTPISDRNFQQLEIRVSHRKHSPGLESNRNFRSTNSAQSLSLRVRLRVIVFRRRPREHACTNSTAALSTQLC